MLEHEQKISKSGFQRLGKALPLWEVCWREVKVNRQMRQDLPDGIERPRAVLLRARQTTGRYSRVVVVKEADVNVRLGGESGRVPRREQCKRWGNQRKIYDCEESWRTKMVSDWWWEMNQVMNRRTYRRLRIRRKEGRRWCKCGEAWRKRIKKVWKKLRRLKKIFGVVLLWKVLGINIDKFLF